MRQYPWRQVSLDSVCKSTGCVRACAAALHRVMPGSPIRWLRGCADACVAFGWRLVAGSQGLLATTTACLWRHAACLAASACEQRAYMFSEDVQPSRRPCLLSRSKRGRDLLRRAPRGAGLCRVAAARRGVQLAPWSAVRARRRARAWSQGELGQRWVRTLRCANTCVRYSE
jgi:hypothetical protein